MPLVDHLHDDVFDPETAPTITVVMSLQAKSLRNEHPPLLPERTHRPKVFGSRETLLRAEQRRTHGSVDERFELEYQSNFGMPCRTKRRRHPTAPLPAQRLAEMKQNTLGSVKPESGSLPQFNRSIFRRQRGSIEAVGFREADKKRKIKHRGILRDSLQLEPFGQGRARA